MKKILVVVISLLMPLSLVAINVQKIVLKNGSELNGYIEQQDGKGKMTFRTESAIVYVNNSNVDTPEHSFNIKALDKAWVKWAEDNDAFEGTGDYRTLRLNDIIIRPVPYEVDSVAVFDGDDEENMVDGFDYYIQHHSRMISNVKILEKGVKVKYLELTPNTYLLSWDDVVAIKAERRPRTALSGINRVYTLRNGQTFEGQYAEETDNTLSLYMAGGVMQTFNVNDVIKYTFKPVNPNQDLFAQSELIDVIRTNNHGEIRGIIIEQNYSSKKNSENYFLIRQESGAIQSVKVSEIMETRKEPNSKFSPKFDILLKDNEVVVNRKKADFVGIKEIKEMLTLDSLPQKTVVVEKGKDNATHITVEYKAANGANVDLFQLVRLVKVVVKKTTTYTFSYKDLVNAIYRPSNIETSINGTTKAEYIVGGTGEFILYDAKNKRGIPFVVK